MLEDDVAAHLLTEELGDVEAEAGAAAGVVVEAGVAGLLEFAEEEMLLLRGNAGAGVGDEDLEEPAVDLTVEGDGAIVGKLHGVTDEVVDHLLNAAGVGIDGR
jgi:hypothetical protein